MKKHAIPNVLLILLLISFIISCHQTDSNAVHIGQYTPAQLDSLTLQSLKKIDNYPFYAMTYYSNYGFDNYLKGKKNYPITWANTDTNQFFWRCSCFASMGKDGDKLYGRNFDYFNTVPLLLYTNPQNGHASISMVDIQFLGYDQLNHLSDSIDSRKALLNAPWLPIDGINEKGVTASLLAVEEALAQQLPTEAARVRLAHFLEAIQALQPSLPTPPCTRRRRRRKRNPP